MIGDVYPDSSALRQLYAHDAHSAAMAKWRFRHPGALPLTRFTRAELVNSMAAAVFRGDITETAFLGFQQALARDLHEDDLRLVDIPWRAVMDLAADLSRQHSTRLGTRTLDVLHVASAMELGVKQFLTYDLRQARLATRCGLKLIQP